MKKFLFLLMAVCSCVSSNAEDILAVTPFKIAANATEGYFTIELNNADLAVQHLSFDLYLPEGMKVYTNNKGNLVSTSMALNTERTEYYDEDEEDDVACFAAANGGNLIQDDNGVDCYRWGGVGEYPVAGTSGVLFNGRYKIHTPLAEGVYPIKMVIDLMDDNYNHVKAVTASYVVVGNPSTASLALTGVIPSFVNAALATETAITTLDLTNVTASNGTFAYVPGRDVKAPAVEVNGDVEATVAPKAQGSYATVCLPFNATIDCYTFDGVEGEYASFTAKTTLNAGESALVDKSVTAKAENVALAAATTKERTTGYYVKDNYFCSVNGSATIPALRGWWDLSDNVRGMIVDGEETSINAINGTESEPIYNVAGVRLNKAQRGVNIVGGKKVVIK